MPQSVLTVAQIAALVGSPVPSTGAERRVTGVASLGEASETDLSLLAAEKYLPLFAQTRAAVVIADRKVPLPSPCNTPVLVVNDVDIASASVIELLRPPMARPPAGVHPSAQVHPSAVIESDVAIAANVIVGANSRIGQGTIIHPGVYIGEDVVIGSRCECYPNVVVRERVTIGNNVILHAGCVIGTDGFGYRWDGKSHVKLPQIGTVIIEDDVEIGSCTCIDRARFSATRIGRGTKIDNMVQVGHNVVIGPHCILVSQVGIAGSAELGAGCVLAAKVGVRDHIKLADGTMVAACSAVANDTQKNDILCGLPAIPQRQYWRMDHDIHRLSELFAQVRKLEKEIERLKGAPKPE